ncbi:MAG: DUF4864 domain-containing protein [Burkholderiales bacterium]
MSRASAVARGRALLVAWVAGLVCTLAVHAAPPAPGTTLPPGEWQAIRAIVTAQLAALKAGDGARAMAFAAPGIQAQFRTPENFLRMVRTAYSALLEARHTEFLEGAVIEGATIQPLRLVLPDDTVLVALYQMQRGPGGRWRIAGCVLAPSTVQST